MFNATSQAREQTFQRLLRFILLKNTVVASKMAPTMIRGLPDFPIPEGLPLRLPHFREVSSFPGPWLRRVLADPIGHFTASLRSKRFRLVSEQKRTEEGDLRFWPPEKWKESQKMKEGRGVSCPPPPRSLTCAIFSQGLWLTLVPRSLLLNRTETLATQAFLQPVQNCLFCAL